MLHAHYRKLTSMKATNCSAYSPSPPLAPVVPLPRVFCFFLPVQPSLPQNRWQGATPLSQQFDRSPGSVGIAAAAAPTATTVTAVVPTTQFHPSNMFGGHNAGSGR